MVDLVEVEYAKYQIAKAETRLASQQALVSALISNIDPRVEAVEREFLLEMQEYLAAALAYHAHILEDMRSKAAVFD